MNDRDFISLPAPEKERVWAKQQKDRPTRSHYGTSLQNMAEIARADDG
jgi:hypothetical protein